MCCGLKTALPSHVCQVANKLLPGKAEQVLSSGCARGNSHGQVEDLPPWQVATTTFFPLPSYPLLTFRGFILCSQGSCRPLRSESFACANPFTPPGFLGARFHPEHPKLQACWGCRMWALKHSLGLSQCTALLPRPRPRRELMHEHTGPKLPLYPLGDFGIN